MLDPKLSEDLTFMLNARLSKGPGKRTLRTGLIWALSAILANSFKSMAFRPAKVGTCLLTMTFKMVYYVKMPTI